MARKMKDSGIEWIGEIPEDWEVVRIKILCKTRNGLAYSNSDLCDEDEGTLVLRASNIKEGELTFKDNVYVNKSIPADLMVKDGDILICSTNGSKELVGKNAIIRDVKASFGAFMMVLRCDNPEMMYYILNSSLFDYHKGSFFTTTINQLTKSNLNNMKIPWSRDSKSRELITLFLNKKNLLIEKIKNTILKEIQTLEDYKKSVITEAVTKGLDKNVEMKDSGIEWIGKIPKHWKIGKTLFYLKMPITDGPHTTPTLHNEGIPFVSAEAVASGKGKIDFNKIRGFISEEFYLECCKKYIPEIDDVYMIKSGATTGLTAIVDTDTKFTIWSPLAVFRADKSKINSKFLFYVLQSRYYLTQVESYWNYGTQQNIGMRTLEKLKICAPPIPEQEKIIKSLEREIKSLDKAIEGKRKQLETLEEYKKSLIYEYVTGKKEVR